MATLNTSAEGSTINRSYQSIVNAAPPSGPAASSSTYGQWAVYTVSAPLVSAFQQDSGKESTLKVQSTAEGELDDLFEEFSDGRIQFAFVRVKDPNTSLPKFVLLAWCGAGVPERSKGNFTSHLATVSKLLHGYHVQVSARSESDLSAESIVRKVSDASGSKYSGETTPASSSSNGPPPPVASKPVFTPTQVGGSSGSFNPLGSRSRTQAAPSGPVDNDGWGDDAPPVIRRQVEKVPSAYKPTKVDMGQLASQKQEPSRFSAQDNDTSSRDDVVRGGYQPVGKVDIAAIRRQAQQDRTTQDDRPTAVKGSYEPVGKVDIAAIRARAQPSSSATPPPTKAASPSAPATSAGSESEPKSLADRSAAFSQSERLTSMPKPKVSNRFGAGSSSFAGTKAPAPGGFEAKPLAAAAPVGVASKTFADQGGKTPAQQWAERKARERGASGAADTARPVQSASPMASQNSGGGQWDSGYSGKKWGAVQTTRTGQSSTSGVGENRTGEDREQEPREDPSESTGNVSAIRDRFKNATPMSGAVRDDDENEAPPPPMASRPTPSAGARGVPMPGFAQKAPVEEQIPDEEYSRVPTPPAQPPRSPTPEESQPEPSSPIRVAQPVARSRPSELEPPEERFSPPPVPAEALSSVVSAQQDLDDEPQVTTADPARGAGQAAATSAFGAAAATGTAASSGGKRALVEFDYEKAEENELELVEGQYVTNIDTSIDDDWWSGTNSKGETGLFPAAYVTLQDDGDEASGTIDEAPPSPAPATARASAAAPAASQGRIAISEFDYEAAEENEISFPENAKITNIEFPDESWWLGTYEGKQGLFPSNYVVLHD